MDHTEAYTKTQLETIQSVCSFVINQMEKETCKDKVKEKPTAHKQTQTQKKKGKKKKKQTNGTHTSSQHDTPNKQ